MFPHPQPPAPLLTSQAPPTENMPFQSIPDAFRDGELVCALWGSLGSSLGTNP